MLAAISKKLEKLDRIEAHLQTVDTDIKELKHSLTFLHDTTSELQKQQEKTRGKGKEDRKGNLQDDGGEYKYCQGAC